MKLGIERVQACTR